MIWLQTFEFSLCKVVFIFYGHQSQNGEVEYDIDTHHQSQNSLGRAMQQQAHPRDHALHASQHEV